MMLLPKMTEFGTVTTYIFEGPKAGGQTGIFPHIPHGVADTDAISNFKGPAVNQHHAQRPGLAIALLDPKGKQCPHKK